MDITYKVVSLASAKPLVFCSAIIKHYDEGYFYRTYRLNKVTLPPKRCPEAWLAGWDSEENAADWLAHEGIVAAILRCESEKTEPMHRICDAWNHEDFYDFWKRRGTYIRNFYYEGALWCSTIKPLEIVYLTEDFPEIKIKGKVVDGTSL